MAPTLSNRSSYSSSLSSYGAMGMGSGVSMGGFGVGSSRSGMGMGMGTGMGMGMGMGMGTGMGMGMGMRSGSVHGGAGGKGIRISSAGSSGRLGAMGGGASFSALSIDAGAGGDAAFGSTNEKIAMQNLNHRLAQYLDKVRILEEANAKLEEKIKNWGLNRLTVETRDFSTHLTTIDEIRTKIHAAGTVVAELALQVDNTKLAADDFKIKFENELSLRQSVEADIGGLKRMLGEMALVKSDLELDLDNLKEELVYLKKNNEEEKIAMQAQLTGQIHVEVDSTPSADLNHVISEIREQYEGMVAKYRRGAEAWFKEKAETVEQEVRASTEVLQTTSEELKTGQTTIRDLEMELQSLFSVRISLEANLADMEGRYGAVMMGLQATVVNMESQLTQIRADTEHTSQEYQALLDIKTRLEMEIAEYRRLLEGEGDGVGFAVKTGIKSTALDIETSVSTHEVESASVSSQSSITTKVVTVVEEMVDGEFISSTSTTTTEEVVVEPSLSS